MLKNSRAVRAKKEERVLHSRAVSAKKRKECLTTGPCVLKKKERVLHSRAVSAKKKKRLNHEYATLGSENGARLAS